MPPLRNATDGARETAGAPHPDARRGDLVAALILVALAAWAASESWSFGLWRGRSPGAGLFPFAAAMLLAGLAAIAFLGALAERRGAARAATPESERIQWPKLGAYVAALVAAALVLESIGYLPTVTLVFLFILRVAERRSWTLSATVTAATLLISDIVFERLLLVELPRGAWW